MVRMSVCKAWRQNQRRLYTIEQRREITLRAIAAGDPDDTDVAARREHSPDSPSTAKCFVVRVG
jgi:hypothetical protein